MTHTDINELRQSAAALPPRQMRQLRDELDRKLSALPAPGADPDADPLFKAELERERQQAQAASGAVLVTRTPRQAEGCACNLCCTRDEAGAPD